MRDGARISQPTAACQEEVSMRLRSVFLLAFAVLLLDAAWTRFAADPPPPNTISEVGWITPISPENTNCPVATHDLRSCRSLTPSHYLVFEKAKGSAKKHIWANVLGTLDPDTCAPYELIHVRRLAKTDVIPRACE
jgi:hypothetical protein